MVSRDVEGKCVALLEELFAIPGEMLEEFDKAFSILIGTERPALEMPDVLLAAVKKNPDVSVDVRFDLTVCTETPEVLFAGMKEFRTVSTEGTAFELSARIGEAEVLAQIGIFLGIVMEPRRS
jgi:hypothetical protein